MVLKVTRFHNMHVIHKKTRTSLLLKMVILAKHSMTSSCRGLERRTKFLSM